MLFRELPGLRRVPRRRHGPGQDDQLLALLAHESEHGQVRRPPTPVGESVVVKEGAEYLLYAAHRADVGGKARMHGEVTAGRPELKILGASRRRAWPRARSFAGAMASDLVVTDLRKLAYRDGIWPPSAGAGGAG